MSWKNQYPRLSSKVKLKVGLRVKPLMEIENNEAVIGVEGTIIHFDGCVFSVFYDKPIEGHNDHYDLLKSFGIVGNIEDQRTWNNAITDWENDAYEVIGDINGTF